MASDYVSLLIDFTKEYESPTSFWRWSAYSTISSILRYNVYLQHKISKVFPNTYTLLLADSARYRKGMPLLLAGDLIGEINCTKTFTGTASVQGILDKLSQDVAIKGKGITIKGGACLILAEELASFFVEDPRLLPLLTNMYDFKKEFPYDLRGGSVMIKNMCVSLLGASNETFLREVYTARANYGGLLRRTLLIKPDTPRPPNSLLDNNKLHDVVVSTNQRNELLRMLTEISKLSGEMKSSANASKLFTNWYDELYLNYDKYGSRTGVVEGIHSLVLKIAIAKSAANCTMEIDIKTMEDSILEVTALKPNYEIYSMSAGSSDAAKISALILSLLWKAPNHTLRKEDILLKHWNEMSSEDFDKVMETFIAAGVVVPTMNVGGVAYSLTKRCLDELESKMNKPKP